MAVTAESIVELFTTVDDTVDLDESDLTPIQEFYHDTNVLITGCMGFLGQILLEKLLRTCPVSKIYVLVRNKKGKTLETRLEEMFNDPLFQRINKQFPETLKKVVPISGDCAYPDLGLGDQDKQLVIDEVDIVFHVAATVRFNEKIKTAVLTNIRATRDLLRLARRMSRLKSFMHVSTAYCNCIQGVIEERIYPPAADYRGMIAMVEGLPENILDDITPKITESYPNTYVYTKQIAEDVVKCEGQGLPVGIHRPSIVISTYREPIRAWCNNLYGPTGAGLGRALGVLRTFHCDEHCIANMVPADMCVNSLIAAAWGVSETFKRNENEKSTYEPSVYNFESSNDKPINWATFINLGTKFGELNPTTRSIWYHAFLTINSYPLYLIYRFFVHTVPALLIDGIILSMGKKPKMMKTYEKIHNFSGATSYFCTQLFTFESKNIQREIQKMTERDRRIFFSNLKEFDWVEFCKCYGIGARTYVLKESLDTLPEARIRVRRLYWLHQTFKVILGSLLIWAAWSLMSFCINFSCISDYFNI